jgi:hypothetical protein
LQKVREFLVLVIKATVSGLVTWFAARGIDVPPDIASQVESVIFFAALGAVNWVLNKVVPVLHNIPGVGEFVKLVWPAPNYQTPASIAYEARVDAV